LRPKQPDEEETLSPLRKNQFLLIHSVFYVNKMQGTVILRALRIGVESFQQFEGNIDE